MANHDPWNQTTSGDGGLRPASYMTFVPSPRSNMASMVLQRAQWCSQSCRFSFMHMYGMTTIGVNTRQHNRAEQLFAAERARARREGGRRSTSQHGGRRGHERDDTNRKGY